MLEENIENKIECWGKILKKTTVSLQVPSEERS
jgi:hypothetical protein